MAEKSYYYLKLKDTFFDSDEMKILESMENGYLYSNILLKLYLKSLKLDGKLMFNEYIPYDSKMLATITGHNIDVVEKAIVIFKQLQLIEILDNGAIYMLNIQNMIGSISTEGIRKAEYRQKIKLEKENKKQIGTNMGQCPDIISISNSKSNSNINNIEEIDKKENKIKETKHKYGEYGHILLKDSELAKLNSEFGEDKTQKAITYLDECIEMKGYKYKSHYLAMRKWVFDALNGNRYSKQQNNNVGFQTREYTKEELDNLYDSLDDIEI